MTLLSLFKERSGYEKLVEMLMSLAKARVPGRNRLSVVPHFHPVLRPCFLEVCDRKEANRMPKTSALIGMVINESIKKIAVGIEERLIGLID